MRYLIAPALALCCALSTWAGPSPEPPGPAGGLDGEWELHSLRLNGRDVKRLPAGVGWAFARGKATSLDGKQVCALKVGHRGSPHIELTDLKTGLVRRGLYRLEGDRLTVAWDAGGERPVNFALAGQSAVYLRRK